MSGEFRESAGYYMWAVLDNIDDPGHEELSQILHDLYKALAPLERACAWVEACDSSRSRIVLDAIRESPKVRAAVKRLTVFLDENERLVSDIVRDKEGRP